MGPTACGEAKPTANRRPGRELYKARNVVERCFGRLKQFRAIATRFDKLADRYRAGVYLASASTVGGSEYLFKAYKDNRILNGDAFWVAIS